jgi:aryl-alcohol dehydrogenase-like predicted oxidoreductase
MMKFRTFPQTSLTVSEIGFGVWTVATKWWGEKSDAEAVALLQQARDLGINFFDTADTYGDGRGESLLQQAFGANPEGLVYASKFGYDIYSQSPEARRGQRELPHRLDPEFVRFACEQSLQRLGVEAIPLWQLHNARFEAIANDELFATLETLKDEGKVLHYGVSLGPANGWLCEGLAALRHRDIASLQIINNILEQYGNGFYADARARNIGLMVRVPHSSGMLEGHYTKDTVFPPGDHRRHRPHSWLINGVQKVETLKFLTEGRNQTLGQAAIKWLLADPIVTTVLPNIYEADQLVEFAAAPDKPDLTEEDLERITELEKINFGIEEEPMQFKGEGQEVLNGFETARAVAA